LLLICILFLSSFHIVYAQSCAACTATPDHIQDYITSMNAILDELESVIQFWAPINDTNQNITTKTNADEILTNSLIEQIVWDPAESQDVFADFKSLWWAEAIHRDKQKMSLLTSRIANVGVSLSKDINWLAKQNINEAVLDLEPIDLELQKLWFVELAKIWSNYNLYNDNTHADLFSLLYQIQALYNELYNERFFLDVLTLDTNIYKTPAELDTNTVTNIADESTREVAWILEKLENKKLEDPFPDVRDNIADTTIYVDIDQKKFFETVKWLAYEYACAEWYGNVCSDSTKDLRDKNRELYELRIVVDSSSAKNIIENANARMRSTFGGDVKQNDTLSESEQALADSKWWENSPENKWTPDLLRSPTKTIVWVWQELWEKFWAATEPFHRKFSSTKESTSVTTTKMPDTPNTASAISRDERDDAIIEQQDTAPKTLLDAQNSSRIQQNTYINLLQDEKMISDTFNTYIFDVPSQANKDLLALNTNTVTKQVVWISKSIHQAANIIWDYDKEWTINHALVNMCEKQCPDLDGSKCRAEN